MKNIKKIEEITKKADNVLTLTEKMNEIFGHSDTEHLRLAIIAGLNDAYNDGYEDGYVTGVNGFKKD